MTKNRPAQGNGRFFLGNTQRNQLTPEAAILVSGAPLSQEVARTDEMMVDSVRLLGVLFAYFASTGICADYN